MLPISYSFLGTKPKFLLKLLDNGLGSMYSIAMNVNEYISQQRRKLAKLIEAKDEQGIDRFFDQTQIDLDDEDGILNDEQWQQLTILLNRAEEWLVAR